MGGIWQGRREEKYFFFEKTKQKTFTRWSSDAAWLPPRSKSFLLLFFKKEVLFFVGTPSDHAPRTPGKSIASIARATASGGGLRRV
jgi:hypothetical protein